MKQLALRVVSRLLDPSEQRRPLAFLQGVLVGVIGLGMALSGYVRRGFKWPADVVSKSGDRT